MPPRRGRLLPRDSGDGTLGDARYRTGQPVCTTDGDGRASACTGSGRTRWSRCMNEQNDSQGDLDIQNTADARIAQLDRILEALLLASEQPLPSETGRAQCRERVRQSV